MAKKTFKKYRINPFLQSLRPLIQVGYSTKVIADKDSSVIVTKDGGEVVARQNIVAKLFREKNEFVKIYNDGAEALFFLRPAAVKVFALILQLIGGRKGKNQDIVMLTYDQLNEAQKEKMSPKNFQRGMKYCLEAGVIAPSELKDIYYFNPRYAFNGGSRETLFAHVDITDAIEIDAN